MSAVLLSILVMGAISLIFGILLSIANQKLKVDEDPLVDQIDAILPQTQCGQCGYPGCRPYAEAVSEGEAINKCPPGGEQGVAKLAELMGVEPIPLAQEDAPQEPVKTVAFIHEQDCIGCTKCIQACPVDAILGATRQMHTVISDECTGCGLCVAPCPTDCIEMLPVATTRKNWQWELNAIEVTVIDEVSR